MERRYMQIQMIFITSLAISLHLPVSGFLLNSGVRLDSSPLTSKSNSRQQQPCSLTTTALQAKVEVTPDLVRKTAGLAQIQITDQEVEALVPRMEEFIGFVETMGESDEAGDGAFATLNCGSNFLRADTAESFTNVAAVMENMPVAEGSYLRVPKVGEDE